MDVIPGVGEIAIAATGVYLARICCTTTGRSCATPPARPAT